MYSALQPAKSRPEASTSILLELALDTVPRVLGLCDRNAGSVTGGCCDRNYWHYRLLDVANARFQEAGYLFALAYDTAAPQNAFCGRQRMADWARLAWRFWLGQRNRDGSLSEVYPNERSFCATSFSAAAFTETIRLLGGAAEWGRELELSRPTFQWLAKNENVEVANQMAASWLALAGYARLTGDEAIARAAQKRRARLLLSQWEDGTLAEYGGLDVGYQTITMSTMARILCLDPEDRELQVALRKAEAVIRPRIGPEGECDSRVNSRATQYIYPYALASLRSSLLPSILSGLTAGTVLRPSWLDDRYCHAMAVDYFLAYREIAACS
ncbi:MAG: hypothetical protein OJJ21_13315 [Ferrovibrio sp.]|uniref:hypothetical protein n=1 Tax=Ferrovibrio sp. TaxID=1917215 RepID=UPI0026330F2A|nr:hypothetical protein [Ferrovibrio sp.]MCW0234574.1 hypothetical protein [Ferrovibrio sp.]